MAEHKYSKKLKEEWFLERNKGLEIESVHPGSPKKFWWKCDAQDDHIWLSEMRGRAKKGHGCPYCEGRLPDRTNNLQVHFPEIAKDWHPLLNNNLEPINFLPKSSKKVWWKCSENSAHAWEAKIANRTILGHGCPECSFIDRRPKAKRDVKNYNLATEKPDLIYDWDPDLNNGLQPEQFLPNSTKEITWRCRRNAAHVWKKKIINRYKKDAGCPFCRDETKLLKFVKPELLLEWSSKNDDQINPELLNAGSNSKFWWKCPKGEDHEWQAALAHRVKRGQGCPFCSGHRPSKTDNFEFHFPDIANEWHPDKNGKNHPNKFRSKSGQVVWWQCKKDITHEWQTSIKNRVNGDGCPYCSNHKINTDNNLTAMRPDIAAEWHLEKNTHLNIDEVGPGSGRKAWWQCKMDPSHVWETTIEKRVGNAYFSGSGCPFCSTQTSQPEIRIYTELLGVYGQENVTWRHKIDGVEVDVFLKSHNVAVEFDGYYWHQDKIEKDKSKNEFLRSKGVDCFRVRQTPLTKLSDLDIEMDGNNVSLNLMQELVGKIEELAGGVSTIAASYIRSKEFCNDNEHCRLLSFLPAPPPELSLAADTFLASQWHPEKNGALRPENFKPHSNKRVWWKCPAASDHEWEQIISARTRRPKCPFCTGQRPSKKYNLAHDYPELALEWNYEENAPLLPTDVTRGSSKKVSWLCAENRSHKWDATISNRTKGRGCPICAKLKRSTNSRK